MKYVVRAPLNRGHALRALMRVLRWQISSRLASGDLIVPFVGDAVLIGRPGLTGMTLNVYCGLAEPEEMGFALHVLRDDSLFVDVGANVGVYTVLASKACGAATVACEPIAKARADLNRNIAVNGIADRVEICASALGAHAGTARMIDDRDTMNRVVHGTEAGCGVEVPLMTLDGLLGGRQPTLIKIDVEGYEEQVLAGADATIRSKSLLAVVLEAGPFAADGGRRRERLCATLADYGFTPAAYDPLGRRLSPLSSTDRPGDNLIFVRDPDHTAAILRQALRRKIRDTSI